MDKRNRLQTNNKVEIIDSKSEYFGKIGKVIDIRVVPIRMINSKGETISSKEEAHIAVKLEETETKVEFTLSQLRKI